MQPVPAALPRPEPHLERAALAAPRPVPAAQPQIDLSVALPIYDEAECVDLLWPRLEAALRATGRSWEAILVDDGSTDGTPAALERIRASCDRVRVLRLARNAGQSAALAAGFHAARGTWVATLDADLQNPPEELARLLAAADGDVDLVFGRRATREDGWLKRVASRVGNGVRNAITGHRIPDTGCGLKLMRREALLRLPLFDGAHRFLPTLFAMHGYATRQVDVAHAPRPAGRSKYGIWRRARRGLVDCLAMRWLSRRSLRERGREL